MRLILATALTLLFLYLQDAQEPNDTLHRNPCKAVSMSEAIVSLLLLLSTLYSWLTSSLLRLVLSVPALVLASLHHSLLLLLAGPWCVVSVCVSLLLTCLHVALYLLHLALVIAVAAILILMQNKTAHSETTQEKALKQQRRKAESRHTRARFRFFGVRAAQQG